ncbi:MAG TPA: GNAT family N-acetyltransferase [Thermoanaerobaculia bacterium]
MTIELVNARESEVDAAWLRNVYPLYLHDLSEYSRDMYVLNDRGEWEPDYLPSWFSEAGAYPLVICEEGVRVGFALVGRKPYPWRSSDCDQRLSEFFILRAHRRSGIGTRAAKAVFAAFDGVWELYELPRNEAAIRFWRGVIASIAEYREQCWPDFLRQSFRVEKK